MKRWLAATLAAVSAAALVVAAPGCTRDPGEVVRLMIWGSPDEVKTVNSYLKAFHAAHPDIRVQIEHTPDMGYQQKLQTLVTGGNLPDVFYVNEADVPWLVRAGGLYDLRPLIVRDQAEVKPDDFYRETQSCFEVGDRTFGVCKDFATLVCYYNKDLFDKWDVPYPAGDWTWEQFLATARATTHQGDGHDDWGFLFETWSEELFPWIWQAGGEVAENDPPRWLMGTPEHVDASAEALQFLSDLIWEHRVSPPPSVTRDQGGSSLFQLGKVAMCTYGRWKHMDFKHISSFEWDTVELPRHRRQATTTFAVAYGVAARTPHPEKAWSLVKFLTNPGSQELVAHSGQAIPSRRSVATSEAFMSPRALTERGLTAAGMPHISQVPHGRFTPRFPAAPECKTRFKDGVEPLWNGTRRDARALLLELQPQIEGIIAASSRADPTAR